MKVSHLMALLCSKFTFHSSKNPPFSSITCILFLVCLFTVPFAFAKKNENIPLTRPLHIGDTIPAQVWNLPFKADSPSGNTASATINRYKGKLLILDFWATWCSPCVAMIPRMDSLQKEFGGKVQFLSVTYQKENEVLPFLEKFEKQQGRHFNIPVITNDSVLTRLFPHNILPHYVWISPESRVIGITGMKAISRENIRDAHALLDPSLYKEDVFASYDKEKSLLIDGNGGSAEDLISHSVLTGYLRGVKDGQLKRTNNPRTSKILRAINSSRLKLIQMAYGNGTNRWDNNTTILAVTDSSKLTSNLSGEQYVDWQKNGNAYSYELILPQNSMRNPWEQMRLDLSDLFSPYSIYTDSIKRKCLAIENTGKNALFKAQNEIYRYRSSPDSLVIEGTYFSVLTYCLETMYLKNLSKPIVNNTGYRGKIAIAIKGDLNTIDGVNKALSGYGLKIAERDLRIPILIIKDRKAPVQSASNN